MKRIVNSEEMRDCDNHTISHFGVPSLVLMERAALSVVEKMPEKLSQNNASVCIICGNGNNGADGLAIARLLYQRGCHVTVLQMPDNGKRSGENEIQRNILMQYGIAILDDFIKDSHYDCIIDSLFGVGLSRAPKGNYAQWIYQMNQMEGFKIAVDMPSGVSSDTGEAYEACFCADLTVTFAYAKLGQLFYPGCEKCGKVVVTEIGITDESWLERKPTCYAYEKDDLRKIPQRPGRSNKGTFGRLLVIAGSKNMAGAALFCAKAAYRTGCGLVKIYTSDKNRTILQNSLPEAVLAVYEDKYLKQDLSSLSEAIRWADVIALGPGIGTGKQAQCIVEQTLKDAQVPMVIDADALNIIAWHPEFMQHVTAPVIFTPHLGEMARLSGKQIPEIQTTLLQTAREFADKHQFICVLKDAVTVTAGNNATYINTSGCNAMAKGGSGDILTGIIAALLAQGMQPEDAAPMGVYLHGLAGEAAAAKEGSYSVLARDIIDAIGSILAQVKELGKIKERRFDQDGRL